MKNKAIRYLISFTVSLFLTLNLVVACAQPKPSPPSPVPPRAQPPTATENQTPEEAPPVNEAINQKEWYTIETFSGKGNDTTPAFHIHGTEWRITWTIDAEHPENAALDLLIHFRNESGSIWKTVTFTDGSSGDITYSVEPGGNRDFFIKIIAQNLRYWTITLKDNAPAATSSPVLITYIRYKGTMYPSDPEEGVCYERVEPDEYVVIKNLSETYVKMDGWVLKNITKGYPSFTFPLNFILGPGQIIRVYTDEIYPECETWREFGTKAPYYTDSEKLWLSFYYGPGDIWSNDKPDIAVLYDAQGNEISRKSYAVPTENE